MTRLYWALLMAQLVLTVQGCSDLHSNTPRNTLHIITSGSHVAYTDEEWDRIKRNERQKRRYVVWGNHAGAAQMATQSLQEIGAIVVERARLQEIFEEQRIQLTHSSDDDSQILKVGRLAGAERVVFIEVIDRPELTRVAYGRSATVYHISVSVRCIDAETAEIRWSGSSTLNKPTTNPELSILNLTRAAMARATCPVERGAQWIEHDGSNSQEKLGCVLK